MHEAGCTKRVGHTDGCTKRVGHTDGCMKREFHHSTQERRPRSEEISPIHTGKASTKRRDFTNPHRKGIHEARINNQL